MSKLCDGVPDCTDGWDEGPHCRGKRCVGTERTARSCGSEMRSISISKPVLSIRPVNEPLGRSQRNCNGFFFPSSLWRKVVNLSISSAARLFPQIPVGMMSVRHGCRPERIPFKSSAIIQRWWWRMSEGTQRTWRGGLCQSTQRGNSGYLQMFASALVDNVEQLWSLLSPFSFSLKSLNQIFSGLSGSKSRSTRVFNLIFFWFFLQFDASFSSFSSWHSAVFSNYCPRWLILLRLRLWLTEGLPVGSSWSGSVQQSHCLSDEVDKSTEWVNVSESHPPAFYTRLWWRHTLAAASAPVPEDTSPAVLNTHLRVQELLRRSLPHACTHVYANTATFMQRRTQTHPWPHMQTLWQCVQRSRTFWSSWKFPAFHKHHSVCLYKLADCVN